MSTDLAVKLHPTQLYAIQLSIVYTVEPRYKEVGYNKTLL